MDGFLALARRYRVPLAGGDTAESPAIARGRDGLIAADIVAVGQAPRRPGAAAIGRSGQATGFMSPARWAEPRQSWLALEKSPRKFAKLTRAEPGHPHLYPEPRHCGGTRLRGLAHAMIDISDGFSTDLTHLCKESRVAATIDEAALPIHPLAAETGDPLGPALNGGEDYELFFTAPPSVRIPRRIAGVSVQRIGTMHRTRSGEPLIVLKKPDGQRVSIKPDGWEHFRPVNPRLHQKTSGKV